ncbi:hypothetical protein UCRNP2_461 [Neofusicoccum parvum UCRNP2]|uniref:Uncharacterized protein n=1 Tax=Botryosphaeria parva (strain UCR-NP2) TaxID=1287680 RepID=R1GM47_BOTPV|nr:hypothetical protein UCRNP2_461 [Neofusicoccum parvum UCRNP2]
MNSGAAFHGAAAGGRRDSVPGAAPADATSAVEDPANQGYDMQALEATTAQTAPGYAAATARSDAAQGQQASLEGNMAELLEAAAKATTESQRHAAAQQQQLQQQQQQQQHGGGLRKIARNTDLRGTAMHEEEVLAAGQKRKRTTSPDGGEAVLEDESGRAGSQSPRKRARQTPEVHSHTPMAHTPMSGADHHGHYHQSPELQQQQQHQAGFGGMTPDARAVGVHSAAALFRTPSTGSGGTAKKHTRPPMSKLFSSLQLTPENFLRLQAAAKQYMLDEAHPERQSCVGSRGKGDTDMVKLRLFNCCRDFLGDGIGERFFGPDVPAPTETELGHAVAAEDGDQ